MTSGPGHGTEFSQGCDGINLSNSQCARQGARLGSCQATLPKCLHYYSAASHLFGTFRKVWRVVETVVVVAWWSPNQTKCLTRIIIFLRMDPTAFIDIADDALSLMLRDIERSKYGAGLDCSRFVLLASAQLAGLSH